MIEIKVYLRYVVSIWFRNTLIRLNTIIGYLFKDFNYTTKIYGPESTNEVVGAIEVVVIPCDVELTKIE